MVMIKKLTTDKLSKKAIDAATSISEKKQEIFDLGKPTTVAAAVKYCDALAARLDAIEKYLKIA